MKEPCYECLIAVPFIALVLWAYAFTAIYAYLNR